MSLPEGVTTATVTAGVPVSHTGAPVKAFLSIEPSAFLVHTATGTPLVDFLEELQISEGVAGQFTLPHTDQAGFQDENGNAYTNWYYTARLTYSTPSKSKTKAPKTKVFQLATGQTVVDLDALPGGAPALPYTAAIPTVTSVGGLTGPVTGSQLAALPELTATYASGGLPAHAGTRTKRYSPDTGAYNFHSGNTKRLRGLLGKARTTGLGVLTFIGDSETVGWGAASILQSIPVLTRDALLGTGAVNGGAGGVPVATSQNDPRSVWTGTWSSNNGKMAWSTVGATLTHTSDLPSTSVKIRYLDNSGSFTFALDGGSTFTVTPGGTNTVKTYSINGLADIKHKIVITSVGAAGTLVGLGFERASGLRINQLGVPGSQTDAWAPTGTWDGLYKIAEEVHAGGYPNAVVIALGVNDCSIGKKTPAVFKTHMTALLNSALVSGKDVILLAQAQPTQNSTTVAEWEAYVSAMYDLADTFDIPLLDAYASVYGPDVLAVANGVTSGDGVHPNGAGYAATVAMLLASPPFVVASALPAIGRAATIGVDGQAVTTAVEFSQSGTAKWQIYQPSGNSNILLRDTVNGRDVLVVTPNATQTNTLVQLVGRVSMANSLTVGQGSGYPTNGDGHVIFAPTTAAPGGTIGNGGTLFVEAGALKFRGSAGTITTIAPS